MTLHTLEIEENISGKVVSRGYYSVETIWAESAIKALKDIGKEDLLKDFNNYKLYVYSILLNRKYILNLAVSETIKIHKNLFIKYSEPFHEINFYLLKSSAFCIV